MSPRRLLPLLLLSSLAGPAMAARVAVLAPKMVPPGARELRDKFHDALAKGLGRAGEIIPADIIRTSLSADLLNCDGGPCVARVAEALLVDRVVIAEIEDVGKTYSIKVRVFDAAGQPLAVGPEERCEICTVREASRAVERAGERSV